VGGAVIRAHAGASSDSDETETTGAVPAVRTHAPEGASGQSPIGPQQSSTGASSQQGEATVTEGTRSTSTRRTRMNRTARA